MCAQTFIGQPKNCISVISFQPISVPVLPNHSFLFVLMIFTDFTLFFIAL